MKQRRRMVSLLLALAIILGCIALPAAAAAPTGTVHGAPETIQVSTGVGTERENNFNEGWKFYLGTSSTAQNPNFDDSSWKNVSLPHDFSISQSFTTSGEAESGFLPGGTGWYRKTFTMPASAAEKTVLLQFDGVYSDAYVYVNGTFVGENHYGYTPFAFDISDNLTCDGVTDNVIAVKAVNNVPSSRWYSGSGIYRDVTLVVTNPVHVDYQGTYVTTPDIEDKIGTVQVKTDVVNDGTSSVQVTVTNTVVETGNQANTTVTVPAGQTLPATASTVVSSPELWSVENPNLYTVRTELFVNGQVVDTVETTFGFRYFSFDRTGFHLNGENVKLNGVCLHHDQGALGSAAYYDAMYRQLSIMKDMGVNAIRTSHNPADEDFIDICNELGLLVIEELFDGWVDPKNGNSYDFSRYFEASAANGPYGTDDTMTWAEVAAKAVVKRDRSDPSVILWSLGNEVQEGTYWNNVSRYADIAQNLINWIKEVDDTRPTTSGDNNRGGDPQLVAVLNTIQNNGGVVGFNYANSAPQLYSLAQNYGGGVIIASETSSATNSRGIYRSQANNVDADGKYHLTSYDTSAVGWGITAHESIYNTYQYDCVAGEFVWTGFDYIGEPTPWNGTSTGSAGRPGAIPNSSYFGIVETTGFPKDTYYLYRSQWNKDSTTLHLVTAWDSDNMMTTYDGKTPVWIYSNAPKVELYRDDVLIGTATRVVNTTAAGHTYYTYTTESNNATVCTTSTGSGADGLYAVFDVAYEPGTISAKAFDSAGNEITKTVGNASVSTPDYASKLQVSVDKTAIDADGASLAYITVDVTDANGKLDTTAINKIQFNLSGNGVILGVDNGDQATTAKYQQSSVLTSETSANIDAYAGKALVIVRSTKDAGSFTVNVTSGSLTGGSVTVNTKQVGEETQTGLTSYTLVRDYSVMAGNQPVLQTSATGTLANNQTVDGTIEWETVGSDIYNKSGDYTVSGTLDFGTYGTFDVTCRVHVIANVVAMRNISTAAMEDTVPTLPTTVRGVLADGTLAGEFQVTWASVSATQFQTVGEIVTVKGTATVLGEYTLPVTATVRVAEAVNTESTNVARSAYVSQDIPAGSQSDTLGSVNNGYKEFVDNTAQRWTNWNNRYNSATATLTFTWATAQMLSGVNLYYYYDSCCAYPEKLEFKYSLNGIDYQTIEATAELEDSAKLGDLYSYTFEKPINPVALQMVFTQQGGTSGAHCVGLIEAEIMTYAASFTYNSSAALSELAVDGTALSGFAPETYEYTAYGQTVTAASASNAGITVLPAYKGVVRVLTVSEDGSAARTYSVTLTSTCQHTEIEIRDAKAATCTEKGYTGDTYCKTCGTKISEGEAIPAAGHTWDEGEVTVPPTTEQEGVKTYTCTVCQETKTENISKLPSELKVPEVSITASANGNKIKLTGQIEDFENINDYYTITDRGLVFTTKLKLGARSLTLNTPGRTRVYFNSVTTTGAFNYSFAPTKTDTLYIARAYATYTNAEGRSVTVYSLPLAVAFEDLG